MKRNILPTLLLSLALGSISSQAAVKYWDNNGATAGAGGPTPTGTWDTTSSKWTTDPTGSSATTTWADSDTAIFSAGSDATGLYTNNLTAGRTVGGLVVKDGIVTFTGSAIALGTSTATVSNSAVMAFGLSTAFSASAGAALVLDNGTARILGAGAGSTFWSVNSDFRLGPGGGTIDVNTSGIAQYLGANGFTLTPGTTAATMTKVGLGEYRSQKGTFTKLVVNQGLWRINGSGPGQEIGFGAVPASYTADAVVVNNCGIGTSVSIITPSQRGITVASGVCTFVLNAGWTINSIITGPGGIALNGNGFVGTAQTLVLTGANSYQGNTTVNLGTLSINSDGTLGAVPSSFTANSITLNGGGLTTTATLTLNANRGIQLTASSPIGVTSGTLTYGGTISGTANTFGLTKTGSGTLTLNGANTFGGGAGGDFTITGGTVNLDSTGAAGAGKIVLTPSSAVTLRNSVTSSSIPNAITANPGTSTIDLFATTANTLVLSGPISGTAVITRGNGGGAGTISLGGDNSGWSGGMEHRGGVLELGHKNALGTATFLVTGTKLATTALQSSTALTGGNAVANAVTLSTNLLLGGVNDLELSGAVALGPAGRTLTVTNSTTLSGVLSGGAGLTKAGAGTLTLSGAAANTYAGTTTNTGGTLVLSKSVGNAVPGDLRISGGTVRLANSDQVADAANVTINGGTLDLQANNETTGGLILTNGSISGSGTLTTTSLDIRSGSSSAVLAGSGVALNKTTSGTATLSGASTYDGGTVVSAGTLAVENLTGSATGPGAVTVAAGATLAGHGSIAGTVDLSGTISPGGSPGTLTTASENWNGGGHYSWQINNATNTPGADPGWDLLQITGGLNITAAATNRFDIDVASLASTNVPGLIDGFDAGASNVWLIAQTTEGITNFDANAFHIVQTGFSNDLGGQIFTIAIDNDTNLVLSLKTNSAPSLTVPADQTVDELTTLTVTNTATDPDAGTALTFSLDTPPSGMTINPTTGVISWTPSEAQGPGSFIVTVVVSDDAQTPLSATNTFNITVNEVNSAPSLATIPNQTLNELTTLNVTASATDSDIPANTLAYSLDTAPTGMTIDSGTGAISWTPAEADGPGVYTVKVVATDNGTPSLSTTNSFTVTVNELNSAPLLTVPANQTVNEQTLLSVSASASDSDIPANTLTFSLPSAPAAMTIDPNTGALSWTPSESDGPAVHTVAVAVTDNGTPSLSVTNTFTVTVNEVNSAPSLFAPADQTIDELTALNVSASATDPDLPANALAFSLGAHPSGMTIVPGTGAISWTPTEAQGPSTNVIEVIVTDDGLPPLSTTNLFTVTVHEVNVAPSLTVPTDQTIDELTTLNVTNTATDADLPANVLTFSLGEHPTGMTIAPDTGIISWTPTEAQGPSSNVVEVIVTDDGSPVLSATNTFAVVVNEVNSAPLLTVPANQTVDELTALNVSASASDSDIPANTLTFNLDSAPVGMTIDPNTGAISWTPTESDGPAIYTIAVAVTDDGTPSLSVTNSFTVTVNEVNTAPLLTVPSDQTINELATLNVSASATDSDLPANILTFSLLAPPAGMTIVPGTGAINWTPTESQGPSTNIITVVVTDNGTPPLSATNSFTVTVNEVNTVPSLPAIADRTIHAGQTLTFTNSATDSDLPANTLSYSLDPGAPASANVGSSSGIFTWATTVSDVNTTNAITVRVIDDGTPALDDSKSFTVTVVSAPTADISVSGNVVTIGWTSIAGQTYRVQFKNNIDDPSWTDLSPDVTAGGSTASTTDTTTSQRFYRVATLP
jgi:autotransporter-associated beta strand protein